MALTRPANKEIAERLLARRIGLERYSRNEIRKIEYLLKDTERKLVEQLGARLAAAAAAGGTDRGPVVTQRLRELLDATRQTIDEAYEILYEKLYGSLERLAADEVEYGIRVFKGAVPGEIAIDWLRPSAEQLKAIATSTPVEGAIVKDWMEHLANAEKARVSRAIQIGMVEQKGIEEIVRDVVKVWPTGPGKPLARRHLRTITRTAVSSIAHEARRELYETNLDVVKGVQWLATLDSRTTEICLFLDGKTWEYDEDGNPTEGPEGYPVPPGPPRHPNCRSTLVPVLRSYEELGFQAGEVSPSTRASMDGQVAESIDGDDWMRSQTKETQEKILGKTRAGIYRDKSDLKLADMLTEDTVEPMTLKQMNLALDVEAQPSRPNRATGVTDLARARTQNDLLRQLAEDPDKGGSHAAKARHISSQTEIQRPFGGEGDPLSPRQVQELLEEQVREMVDEAEAFTRVKPQALQEIIESGRLKSQFETNTSGGLLDQDLRARFEQSFFGMELDVAPSDRPVYGYLSSSADGLGPTTPGGGHHILDNYGRISVKLSPAARDRVTFNFGDSLDSNPELGEGLAGLRTPAPNSIPTPMNDPDWRSLPANDLKGVLETREIDHYFPYVEAQFHGGITLDDFEEVIFYKREDYEHFRPLLAAKGVRSRHVDPLDAPRPVPVVIEHPVMQEFKKETAEWISTLPERYREDAKDQARQAMQWAEMHLRELRSTGTLWRKMPSYLFTLDEPAGPGWGTL